MSVADQKFGPRLPGAFDFTIHFEQSILSLLPTVLFLIITTFRLAFLTRRPTCNRNRLLLGLKLATITALLALRIALLALWSRRAESITQISVPDAALGVLAAIAIAVLSSFEHVKSPKPSVVLNAYLFFTIILDLASARTYWMRSGLDSIAAVNTATLAVKAILFVLEESPKTLDGSNPAREASAGIISRSLFWWLNRLLFNGSRDILDNEVLGPIDSKFDSEKLLKKLEAAWDKDSKDGPYSLISCTFRAFGWRFAAAIPARLLYIGFLFAQPFLIQAVVEFVGNTDIEFSAEITGGLIGATALVYVGIAMSGTWFTHLTYQGLTLCRGGLVSLIYKHTLTLDAAAVKESAPVTLMSTDIEAVVYGGAMIHDVWAGLVEIPVGIYLLYRQVGYAAFLIFVPVLLTSIAGIFLSPAMGPAQIRWMAAVQKRIDAVSKMLSQAKVVKMMGLSNFFHQRIRTLRAEELDESLKYRWLLVHLSNLAMVSEEFTPVIIIIAAVFLSRADSGLSIAQAFSSLTIISIAAAPLVRMLLSITQVFAAIGSFTRLQDFLKIAGKPGSQSHDALTQRSPSVVSKPSKEDEKGQGLALQQTVDAMNEAGTIAEFNHASFTTESDTEVLSDISLMFPPGSVSMIVGRVGCGKSSLLRAIIGELNLKEGSFSTSPLPMAYCDQTPWLQNLSVRDNILGQSDLDEKRLASVIHACDLEEDIASFLQKERSLVGTGGIALSGGQKQRLAMARAVYANTRIIVLDDPFSGLDSTTSRNVFDRLLGPDGLLRRSKVTVIMATNQVHFLSTADYITVLEEGRVSKGQVSYDSVEPSVWGVIENETKNKANETSEATKEAKDPSPIDLQTSEVTAKVEKDLSRQTGDSECYTIYLKSLGRQVIAVLIVGTVLHAVLTKMPQIWLKKFTEDPDASKASFAGGYVGLVVLSLLIGSINFAHFIITGVTTSAQTLHDILLRCVTRAPLHFFTTVDSGVTLNRFSQDMTLIDSQLPINFFITFYLVLRAIVETGIIASGANYVGAIIPACILVLYLVQKYYLRTSRQMRFLDLEAKSPLYTQFTETLAGLHTIRTFGWSAAFLRDNHRRLDASQKPFYTMFCIQRWLQVVLDLFVAGMAVVLVSFSLSFPNTTSQGAIGLAMVNLIGFNQTLTLTIDQWTELETSLGAIARLKWFRENTPDENRSEEKEDPPSAWPIKGLIELNDVTAAYSHDAEPVLRNLTLRIEPGQKVGICGRSGSGKSSLVLALLRLLEVQSGTLHIDGVDLTTLRREDIRSRISTLPQDPLRMPGSIRDNLDPEGHFTTDEPLVDALNKAGIRDSIMRNADGESALNTPLEDLGLSVGQLQLFCLARALLFLAQRDSAILLLDEATSSVDSHTEEAVRRQLAPHLTGRTVVEVAHRLDVVRSCDIVVVMDAGRLVEMGPPEELLEKDGAFKTLWESRGRV